MFIAFALEGVAMMLWLACREIRCCLSCSPGGVLWLGRSLPVDTHRYVRQRACRHQLWLAVYFAGHRVNLGGPLAVIALSVGMSSAALLAFDFITAALRAVGAKTVRARFIRQHS